INDHNDLQKKIVSFCSENDLPIVAAHDVYYLKPEDRKVRDVVMSIASSGYISQYPEENFSFISPDDIKRRFKDLPQAIQNTNSIADRCNVEIKLGDWHFPKFDIPQNTTYESELKRLVEEGFSRRGLEQTQEVKERIEYE